MNPTVAGYLVFGSYIVLIVVIGLWSGRQQKGADDLWTAGRRFGTVVMVLGLMSSVMHGGSILSGVAFAAAYGGVAILPLISFAAGFLVILLFFARKLRDIGAFTLSDFMADRYDSVGLRAFTAVVIAISCTVYLVAQIRGMGIVLSGLLDLPFVTAMAVGTLLFVFYVVVGGILAVMWTNIAQFLFMWLGLLVIIPYVWQTAGGWTTVLERAEALAPGWTSVAGTQWIVGYLLSWWLVWFMAYSTRIELITKVFIARDSNVARYALPTTCLLVMIFLLFGNLYLGRRGAGAGLRRTQNARRSVSRPRDAGARTGRHGDRAHQHRQRRQRIAAAARRRRGRARPGAQVLARAPRHHPQRGVLPHGLAHHAAGGRRGRVRHRDQHAGADPGASCRTRSR